MGGFGSGPTASTPTVGECHTIDVGDLTDSLGAVADTDRDDVEGRILLPYRWRDEHGHGEEVASAGLYPVWEGRPRFARTLDDVTREDRVDALEGRPTALRIKYTVTPRGGESTEYDYRLPLEYTPCNFGGVRPWFRCPSAGCADRVGKLHRPPGRDRFACRECFDLGYLTSRRSGDEMKQAELRYRRAFAKADAKDRRPHPNNGPRFPERPTGMHHDTFEDLVDDVQAARREYNDAEQARLRALVDRHGDVFGDGDGLEPPLGAGE